MNLLKQNTVTRDSLAKAIKRDSGIAINKAADILDSFLTKIVNNVKDGRKVKIRLFGNFYGKKKSARVGRNPKTMKSATIPARTVFKFKVAPTLKKRINSNITQISA